MQQRNPDVTYSQWSGFKTMFRHEWWQWSEEKRKQELRMWIIRAWYVERNRLADNRKI